MKTLKQQTLCPKLQDKYDQIMVNNEKSILLDQSKITDEDIDVKGVGVIKPERVDNQIDDSVRQKTKELPVCPCKHVQGVNSSVILLANKDLL